jgi:Tol biopolymer transport system component
MDRLPLVLLRYAAWIVSLCAALVTLALMLGRVLPGDGVIAFGSAPGGLATDIYMLDVSRGWLVNLTHDDFVDSSPSWSSDGNQILFTSSRDGDAEIYATGLDGHSLQQLTDNSADDL